MHTITINVRASASQNAIVPTGDDTFEVHVKAPAAKGKANKQAIKDIARHLGLPQSRLMLVKGEKFHIKTILVMDED